MADDSPCLLGGPPVVELCGEPVDPGGVLGSEVVLFEGVLEEIVEFDLAGSFFLGAGGDILDLRENEFPFAFDAPAIGEVTFWPLDVDCVVEEDFAVDGVALVKGLLIEQVDALHVWGGRQAAGAEDGWDEVDADDRGLIDAGFDLSGPADHDGRSEAAVVLGSF